MSNKFLIFLFLILQSSTIYSQLTTDRPSQTDSPLIIETGYVQVETGVSVEETQSKINSLFRIGILNGVELRDRKSVV